MTLIRDVPMTLSVVSMARTFAIEHLFAGLIAFILIRCIYKRYFSPLRNFPGPPLASVSRLWRGALITIKTERDTSDTVHSLERLDWQERRALYCSSQ